MGRGEGLVVAYKGVESFQVPILHKVGNLRLGRQVLPSTGTQVSDSRECILKKLAGELFE